MIFLSFASCLAPPYNFTYGAPNLSLNTSISYGSIPKKPVPNTLETASFTAKLPAKVAALSFAHANSVVVKILVRRLPL